MPCMLSYPHRLKSGQITCYLNRTYHVLTTPQKGEVARFSESHLSCATENGIDVHLSQARTVYRGVTIRSNVDLDLPKTLVHSPLGRPYVEQNNKTHRSMDSVLDANKRIVQMALVA